MRSSMLFPCRVVAGGFILLVIGLLSRTAAQPTPIEPTVTFKGHQEAIYSVAFSGDGKIAATGSFDKSVKLWEPKTGKELRAYSGATGNQNIVLSVAISPNGDSIASGGSDNSARIWDIPTSTPVRDFSHTAGATSVSVSLDGKQVAGGGKDGSIKLWTTADGKQTFSMPGHPGGTTGVWFYANGQSLASGGIDGLLRFWNPANGQQTGQIGAHVGPVTGVAVHPNNNTVYSIGEDGSLKFWQLPVAAAKSLPAHADAVTAMFMSNDGGIVYTAGTEKIVKASNINGQLAKEFPGAGATLNALTASGNGSTVIGGGNDGKLYLWKSDDGKLTAQVLAHAGGVTGVAYHPTQPVLASVGADGLMRTWALPVNPSRTVATPDRVLATALSGDGKRLFTAGADKVVRSWNVATGAAERQFPGHTGVVTAVAVSADGNTLVSAGADESIRFWNGTNGMQTGQLGGHVGGITSLALTAQGNLLVSAGEDGTVKIWQLPLVAAKSFAHPEAINGLALSEDGNRLLSIGNDKQARLWNLGNGQVERAYTAGSSMVTAIAFANDSNVVAVTGADKSLAVTTSGKEGKKFEPLPSAAQSIALAPNGANVAVGLTDNSIRLFQVNEAKELKNIPGHTGAITALRFTSKGDLLISASADKSVRLWNAADGAAKGQINHSGPVSALAVTKDGSRVAAGGVDKSISMWTLADNKPAGTIATPAEVRGISFSPDGQKLAVAGSDGKVRVYGIDGKLQETFSHDGVVTGVAFLPDGKRLISSSADKTARLWTCALIVQARQVGSVRQVLLAPQGDRVFSVGDDKQLRIWDAKTAKELKAIPAHDGPVLGLALSADVSKAVTIGDKSAKVWTLADGKLVTTIPLTGQPQTVSLSPNGTRIAVAYADKGNRISAYDAATGKELQSLSDSAAPIRSLSFLPDNRTLISAGDDKNVNVQDVAVQSVLAIHSGGATGIAYHPNGTQVITSGRDKSVRLWDLAASKEVKSYGPMADPVSTLTVSRDFALVAASAGKVVKVWQINDGKEIATINHPAEVNALSFSPEKTRLVTGANDNLARVWEIAGGRMLQTYGHAGAVRGVAYHPTQPLVVTASADKTVMSNPLVINRAIPASAQPLRAMTVTATGSHVITGGDDKNVKAWNATNGADERTFAGAEGPVYAIAVSKNVQLFAAAGADKKIRVYTFADGKLVSTISAPSIVRGLAFHPTLPILGAVCDDKSVNSWNIAMQIGQPLPAEFGRPIQSFAHGEAATGIAFADVGGALFTSSMDKTVKQWKIAADGPVRNFQHPNLVDSVAFDPPGKQLATGCHDGILRIHDIEKNAVTKSINAHIQTQPEQRNHPIYSVIWSADGKQVLSASNDASAKLWDVASGNLVREFKPYNTKDFPKGHRDQIFCAIFSKDGKFLVTGSSDRMIKLWNVADGTVAREFANPNMKQLPAPESPEAHPGWVYGVRFSADEKHLISVGSAPRNKGYLAVWNVADGKMLYGQEQTMGPIYSVVLNKEGTHLLLGCGPPDRQVPEASAVIVPIPVK